MFTLVCEYPKPKFVMHFQPSDFHNFYQVRDWLVEQTQYEGWKFKSLEHQHDGWTRAKMMTALSIDSNELAIQAKLMFPNILMSYDEWERKLGMAVFFDRMNYRRIDSPNYDIIPINDSHHQG